MLVIVELALLGGIGWAVWTRLLGRRAFVTAPAAFLAYQFPTLFGFIIRVKSGDNFGILWVFVCLLGMGSFVWGACFANRHYQFRPAPEIDLWRESPVDDDLNDSVTATALIVAISVCLAMGVLFARRVGYNTLGIGFRQLLHTGSVDNATISSKRAGATLGQYTAAGYTAQFTAVILPVIILLFWTRAKMTSNGLLRVVALFLAVIDLYFLTIVGGRTWLIAAVAMAVLVGLGATGPFPRYLSRRGSRAMLLILGVIVLYGFTTVLQGRSTSQSTGAGIISQGTSGLYDRLAGTYSGEQLTLIRIIHTKAPVYGSEWLSQLTLLHRKTGPGTVLFDQRLYALVYNGDTRGDLPLNVWGATYYNWGLQGMILVDLLAGFLMQRFTIINLMRKPRTLSRVVIFTVIGYRLGLWIDPYTLLLQGAPTLLLFYGILHLVKGWDKSRATGTQVV